MTTIHVCPLSRLEETVRAADASHLVTLLADGPGVARPAGIAPVNHLDMRFGDISEPMEGHVLADAAHVRELLAFVTAWPRERPLVIHCYAGISRSTAAAFATLCALRLDIDEADHAAMLRAASPTATPNRHLVTLADGILGREGRMIEAIDGIGRGANAYEGEPFALAID